MTTTKKELSYFRLKLEAYLGEHFPERVNENTFITARADEALTTYCDAIAQGFSHPEAETMASEVLYQGLHFSKYDTLVSVLENEFEKELPSPLPERLAPKSSVSSYLSKTLCTALFFRSIGVSLSGRGE